MSKRGSSMKAYSRYKYTLGMNIYPWLMYLITKASLR